MSTQYPQLGENSSLITHVQHKNQQNTHSLKKMVAKPTDGV